MAVASASDQKSRAVKIAKLLAMEYADARCALEFLQSAATA